MGITIKDVAAAAGTSVSTVSKVINGHYSISEETAARVRRVMQNSTIIQTPAHRVLQEARPKRLRF